MPVFVALFLLRLHRIFMYWEGGCDRTIQLLKFEASDMKRSLSDLFEGPSYTGFPLFQFRISTDNATFRL